MGFIALFSFNRVVLFAWKTFIPRNLMFFSRIDWNVKKKYVPFASKVAIAIAAAAATAETHWWNTKWAVLTHVCFYWGFFSHLRSQKNHLIFVFIRLCRFCFVFFSLRLFLFFENHRQLRLRIVVVAAVVDVDVVMFSFVWFGAPSDVKPCDLIISLSPNNFTTFAKGENIHTFTRI